MNKALESLDKAIESEETKNKAIVLRRTFASAFARTRNYKAAAEQYEKLLSDQLDNADTNNAALLTSLISVQSYFRLARRTGDLLPIADRVDERVSKSADELADKIIALRVHSIKAKALAATNTDAAEKLLLADYEMAKKAYDENSDDDEAAKLYAWSLNNLYMLDPAGDGAAEYMQAHQEIAKELAMKARNQGMFRNYMTVANGYISSTYREDPKAADTAVQSLKATIDDFRDERPEYKAMLASYERSLASTERRIASALKIMEMIGQPAPEMDVAAWVTQNDGDTPVDLKGKVVLVDFWAIWCGPCVRTFPHLKHLNETYGDGLQIVGVTRYYGYKWNEKTKKAVRGKERNADLEHEALRKFMASHDLEHPTIVVPDGSAMQQEFGVSGIPHAVVIDQEGAIQLIKVGSGEANAKAIEAKIKELLK